MPSTLHARSGAEGEKVFTGQIIFAEGQRGDKMYILKEGEVDLWVGDKLINTVGRGDIFGEMALIDFGTRSATAKAKTDCVLVALDEKKFLALVQTNPKFALQVMRVLVQRLRSMDRQVK
jgi:CRP-like cAMP-binding protein